MRHWLLRRIAGERGVMLNVRMVVSAEDVAFFVPSESCLADCTFKGCGGKLTLNNIDIHEWDLWDRATRKETRAPLGKEGNE
jgi:hypothetical protein